MMFGECGEAKFNVSVSFGTRALFNWKGKSTVKQARAGLTMVMDGQCQDEFLHCTDPGLEQEWINVTFRWIKQHGASCLFLRRGSACCLPTCAQGSPAPVTEFVGNWLLFIWRVLALLVYSS